MTFTHENECIFEIQNLIHIKLIFDLILIGCKIYCGYLINEYQINIEYAFL